MLSAERPVKLRQRGQHQREALSKRTGARGPDAPGRAKCGRTASDEARTSSRLWTAQGFL